MLEENKEKKEEYYKQSLSAERKLKQLLEKLELSFESLRRLSQQRPLDKFFGELDNCTVHESALIINELCAAELKRNETPIDTSARQDQTRQEVMKELASCNPDVMFYASVSAGTNASNNCASAPLSVSEVYDLKEYVGGLLTNAAVKSDPELKQQVLNMYYRLDYLFRKEKEATSQGKLADAA